MYNPAVYGSSATESGYEMLPLMAGVMTSSILSGFIVARTGRYKWMTVGAMALAAVGLYLMTNLRADTDILAVWGWMLLAGLGLGPSFAVFTIIVQSAAAPRMLGAATSALTFFRQVGGSVGLALAGTVFGTTFADEVPRQLANNGLPQPMIDAFSQNAGTMQSQLTGVGVNLGDQILSSVPAQARPAVEPFIDQIVNAIYQGFSIAIANALWLGVVGAALATVVVAVLVPEVTLRRSSGLAERAAEGRPTHPVPIAE
jgi:hypothetical protein